MKQKTCSKCKQVKDMGDFNSDRSHRDGHSSRCRVCLRTFVPREANCYFCTKWFSQKTSIHKFCKDVCRMKYWMRIQQHSVARAISLGRFYRSHRDSLNEKSKAYYRKNREKVLAYHAMRRIQKKLKAMEI